jgi:hypothetical protein
MSGWGVAAVFGVLALYSGVIWAVARALEAGHGPEPDDDETPRAA